MLAPPRPAPSSSAVPATTATTTVPLQPASSAVTSSGLTPFGLTASSFATMDSPAIKREDGLPMIGRHRASSDPLSRGGNFAFGDPGRLDQEPNPFEQSFSGPGPSRPTDGTVTAGGRRARSTSPSLMPRATPGIAGSRLPPLALMQTPGADLSAFGWGVDSLRTGSLSPALLNGPAYDPSMASRTGLTPLIGGAGATSSGTGAVSFPPPSPATAALFAMMTNNTPGTADASALAGGGPRPHEGPNEGNQFEASFARANSGGVGESKLRSTGTSEGPSGSLPPATQAAHVQAHPAPLTALHRSAINNQLNGSPRSIPPGVVHPSHGAPPSHSHTYLPPHAHPYAHAPGFPSAPHGGPGGPSPLHLSHLAPHQAPPYPPAPGASAATNPLDLLSQASFHNDDAVVAAAALSGLATPGGGFNAAAVAALNAAQNGHHPPSVGPPPPGGIVPGSTVAGGPGPNNGVKAASPAPSATSSKGKRGAAGGGGTASKRARKSAAASEEVESSASGPKKTQPKRAKRGAAKKREEEDDDMEGDEDMEGFEGEYGEEEREDTAPAPAGNKGGRGRKKDTGETEEEKRKNFLERNRQAALKCRQRKKAWLQSLQTKVELLTTDNDTLQSTVNNLREEVSSLRAILAAHSNCPVALGNVAPSGPHPGVPMQQHEMHNRRSSMPAGALGMQPGSLQTQGYAHQARF
ncbi:hypothetical protein JCM1841_001496 [Sporobolomyces salmonicolor]